MPEVSRRTFLKATGATTVASSLPFSLMAARMQSPFRVAVISDEILERAREGAIPMITDMMEYGATILQRKHVMTGVPEMLTILQVEALFPDGTKLVTVMNPIRD